jgi:hypothetical protein
MQEARYRLSHVEKEARGGGMDRGPRVSRALGAICMILFMLAGAFVQQGRAGEVDTLHYGQIETGMKEAEVKRRLGPPDRVEAKEDHKHYRSKGTGRVKHIKKTKYVYDEVNPASGQKIKTTILFENGKVVEKKREYK